MKLSINTSLNAERSTSSKNKNKLIINEYNVSEQIKRVVIDMVMFL